ncbi:Receiver protein of a two-component response regulator [Leptospira biflexa serovar Patoc strain 'Patoc 1 (Ames)']|uniref:Putative two-component response regulator n=1 Tax=Leptospira biflexa serovar Patoc (strain Patoc 1 / ATCC 23582 / Paris) TaxID=456481 RepID=B0SP33_LEPBP|nr:response regulator [Leptospira biflexa]ABZ95350.1 Receiver protein of a two-component response regulator [Leptospira biflexa serovar Patoc strain 'Patoc 1 (Ames)']ABZ99045.1 Putative two-component response regulator [Leptospira biflexa serovar Patoc strain 'Patoc 1 (Paris)']
MNPRICIIDDDKIYQFTTKKIIANAGITVEVLIFSDAENALSFFQEESDNVSQLPDIVFLDINMPFMDGWQFLEAVEPLLSKFPKPIRIYLVSSSVDDADTERAAKIPYVSGYIFKPFTKEKLLDSLAHLQS